MNDVLAHMEAHRSVRRFLESPVADAVVERAVGAARHAATSHWVQAYGALRVREPGTRARLAELCGGQAHVERAPVLLAICGDTRRHRVAAAGAGAARVDNLETFVVAAIDAALFAQNLALALEAQGLGICFIGGLRNDLAGVCALLEVPRGVWPFFGMVAGYPDEEPVDHPRLPVRQLLHEERWPDDDAVARGLAEYDAALAPWWSARERPGRTWSGQVARLFSKPARAELAATYRSLGAVLD